MLLYSLLEILFQQKLKGDIVTKIRFKKAANQLTLMKVVLIAILIVGSFFLLSAVSVSADYLTVQGNQVTVNNNTFTSEKASAFLDVWQFKYTTQDDITIIRLPAGMELKSSNIQPVSTKSLIRELFFWIITQNEGTELTFNTNEGTQLDIVYGSASNNPFKFDFKF